MEKYNYEVRVFTFYNDCDLISQVIGDYVSFDGDDMYIYRNESVCALYHINKVKKCDISDKCFDFNRGVLFENIFIDI